MYDNFVFVILKRFSDNLGCVYYGFNIVYKQLKILSNFQSKFVCSYYWGK